MSVFETLREQIPLARIVSANGSGKAHCVAPNHRDETPSMHMYGDRAHCFSCGFHEDVVGVHAAIRGFDSQFEAALDLAREFHIELPEISPEARRKAEERRSKEERCLNQARAFHRALDGHPQVVEWWETRGFTAELRQKFLLGANKDGSEAVIPFWNRGRVHGLIRRKLEGKPKYRYPNAEELAAGVRPLFMPGSVRGDTALVEGIVDALSLSALGESAIAVGGTDISETQMEELEKLSGSVYIFPDDDDEGDKAARRWVRELYPAARLCPAEYGDGRKDVADLFAEEGEDARERLADLKKRAVDALDLATSEIPSGASKRRTLTHVREYVIPLLLRGMDPPALFGVYKDGPKDSELLAALDDIAATAKLKLAVLKNAVSEEAKHLLSEFVEKAETDARAKAEANAVPEKDYAPLLEPGVLDRYVEDAAGMHGVIGDESEMRLITLVALGAQLGLLPNRKPSGGSLMLVGDAGRGKNYLTDAVVSLLPPKWYLAFESASAASLYYQVENNPDFLRHRFCYPNEAEATDQLVEFLRPMLSAGKAVRLTVNSTGAHGANEAQELEVRGPITAIIPTIRNKIDEQLQTRLLVGELEDYGGRVKKHSQSVSALYRPDFSEADDTGAVQRWRAALQSLTDLRRVVIPIDRPEFAFDNDSVSHGARLWANLLGLMCAHAFLEQRNRETVELPAGEKAIAATPKDYETAYRVFEATCQRTVANISETHRKILDAAYALAEDDPDSEGFSQRKIAEEGGVSVGAVSKHKSFLVMSAKLLKETDYGLTLVSGAEPSWWAGEKLMRGFPSPEKVREWWDEDNPPSPDGGEASEKSIPAESREHREHPISKEGGISDTYAGNGSRDAVNTIVNAVNTDENGHRSVHAPFTGGVNTENGVGKRNTGNGRHGVHGFHAVHGVSGEEESSTNGRLTVPKILAELNRPGSGPNKALAVYLEDPNEERLEYLTCAVLHRLHPEIDFDRWEEYAPTVREALSCRETDKTEITEAKGEVDED